MPKNILTSKLCAYVASARSAMGLTHYDDVPTPRMRGDIFFRMIDTSTGEVLCDHAIRNIITRDMSILVARLLRSNGEPSRGLSMLAVGTGDIGWNPMAPPVETNTQRSLYNEIARKPFAMTTFVDAGGNPTLIPTNVIDLTTTFSEAEAVGPLVEMGLLGGDADPMNIALTNPILPPNGPYDPAENVVGKDMLCNYKTFPVINKPATATLTITWRITT